MKEKKLKILKYDAETMQKYLNECTVDAYEKGLQVGYERGKADERKKTLEEVWGFINEKMDTLDINKHEPEINILSWLNKKIDFNITRLSKLLKEGNEKE